MSNFNVGDKVIAIKAYEYRDSIVGKIGTIVNNNGDGIRPSVDFDENIGGHNCGGKAKSGHGWNMPASYLKSFKVDNWKKRLENDN